MRPIYFFKQVVFKAITPFRFFLCGLILAVFMPVLSNAQIHPWVKHEDNPIIEGTWGNWNENMAVPVVIYDDDLYKMWFTGRKGGSDQIGYAESPDGIHWDLEEAPVIPKGLLSDWDYHRFPGTVLHMNGTYKMWYSGIKNSPNFLIGYAESEDGLEWNVHPDPVFEKGDPGAWDEVSVGFPQVIYKDGLYHMYYAGGASPTHEYPMEIGYATSTDGKIWDRKTKVIPLGEPGTFSDTWVRPFGLVLHNDTLRMFYEGYDGSSAPNFWFGRVQVGYAWSTDPYDTWVTDTTVDLGVGEPGEWDQHWVGLPTVLVHDDTMKMWYTGFNNDGTFTRLRIGYASYHHPTISGTVNRSPLLPDVLSVSPNPFTGLISISFELPKRSMVQLEVYNSSGQLISTLVNEIRQQGAHEVSFEGAQLPPGVYFCTLKTSEGVQMGKMVKQ